MRSLAPQISVKSRTKIRNVVNRMNTRIIGGLHLLAISIRPNGQKEHARSHQSGRRHHKCDAPFESVDEPLFSTLLKRLRTERTLRGNGFRKKEKEYRAQDEQTKDERGSTGLCHRKSPLLPVTDHDIGEEEKEKHDRNRARKEYEEVDQFAFELEMHEKSRDKERLDQRGSDEENRDERSRHVDIRDGDFDRGEDAEPEEDEKVSLDGCG